MNDNDIRRQHRFNQLDENHQLRVVRTLYRMLSSVIGLATLGVIFANGWSILSMQAAAVVVTSATLIILLYFVVRRVMQSGPTRKVVAFTRPNWNADTFSVTIAFDNTGKIRLAHNPVVNSIVNDEWIGLQTDIGRTYYVLSKELDAMKEGKAFNPA